MLEAGAFSHRGLVRRENEDGVLALPEHGIFVVADGMGGHEAGALASSLVVKSIASLEASAEPADVIRALGQRVETVNDHIWTIARDRGAIIGSTVAALVMGRRDFACLWAGDSRVYRVRGGDIEQISHDHTEVQELVDQGVLDEEQARTWPRRNVITRAIGVFQAVELDVVQGSLETGDVFVLCSDGLTAHVEDAEIAACARAQPPQAACDALVALTLERGATDNVTVIVVAHQGIGGTDTASALLTRSGRP